MESVTWLTLWAPNLWSRHRMQLWLSRLRISTVPPPAPPQPKGKNYALWNSSCSDSGNTGLRPRHKPFNLLISAFQILTECFSWNTEHNNIQRTKNLAKICCGHLLSETDILLILFYHCLMSRSYQILVSCKTSRRHNNWGSRNASELVAAAGRPGQAPSWPAWVAAGVSQERRPAHDTSHSEEEGNNFIPWSEGYYIQINSNKEWTHSLTAEKKEVGKCMGKYLKA